MQPFSKRDMHKHGGITTYAALESRAQSVSSHTEYSTALF
jgi:hypothetical protein